MHEEDWDRNYCHFFFDLGQTGHFNNNARNSNHVEDDTIADILPAVDRPSHFFRHSFSNRKTEQSPMFQVSVTSRCHLDIDLLWHKPCRANLKKEKRFGFSGLPRDALVS